MKVGIGSDHGGYELKEYIKGFLEEEGIEYIDYGTNSSESVDYPEFGEKVALAVKNGECDRGIVVCGTGIGISISCNKVAGIRCALCGDTYSAKMSVEHNNAQVLALGGRVVGKDLALEIVSTWLSARFQGGRHERRVNKISDIETKYML
ncbi:ribose 5-phosphate isomerase B [Anaerosalibacter bizertensis]|uniref:Ribose 5-phosphate isomerase B n=1 Tax=Anaerosalibacter bizertensis TaxID=932217 RepID=A0A844FK13_9FIRM|nr:ribose 5-phosphate isomerase B [Anaerosalibacter bizertensis]MBU5293097.1 ribose 5-phosphate isomerase B [Anaerosalibacter bizertensis]MSS44281.1 ribose 5-phosphate isomerase B [Anaerosalibacter bizertensis]HHV27812.1 ribose 5-phosphate isomerase B [Tissierellia bacterium]